MKTQYYRVQAKSEGAYGFSHDGTILVITEKGEYLLTDNWCGSGVEGECYRQHVNGKRKPWPKAADAAKDMTAAFDDLPEDIYVSDLDARQIRSILGV